MSEENKARQFWITPGKWYLKDELPESYNKPGSFPKLLTIELAPVIEMMEVLNKALEVYADKYNYDVVDNGRSYISKFEVEHTLTNQPMENLAKSVLEKYKAFIKENGLTKEIK